MSLVLVFNHSDTCVVSCPCVSLIPIPVQPAISLVNTNDLFNDICYVIIEKRWALITEG